MKIIKYITIAAFAMAPFAAGAEQVMNLAGKWTVTTELSDTPATVTLPGTLDTNGIGTKNDDHTKTTELSRKVTYAGLARYERTVDIPKSWKGKEIILELERTRPSEVWVDGTPAGSCRLLSTPHFYNLSKLLTPGKHTLTISIDNGKALPDEIKANSHAATESTQTNWNGIVGKLQLIARNLLNIKDIQVYPQANRGDIKVKIQLSQNKNLKGRKLNLSSNGVSSTIPLQNGKDTYEAEMRLCKDAKLWSEHSPALHTLCASIAGVDTTCTRFGLRKFEARDHQFWVNDTVTFLRGRHDACVWPLTGYAAMDTDAWRKYFQTIKQYGLNHVRFHSWCPPEACFEAADIEGIYLQPELPIWGSFDDKNTALMDFLKADGDAIQRIYSKHPSFVMMGLGNELWGEVEVMQRFTDSWRSFEPRHLYTYGSNAYLGFKGNLPGQDFFVTCRVGGGENYATTTRASFSFADEEEGGYMNNTYPGTWRNFESAVMLTDVPVVGHETAQYQIYPDFTEMAKYTGVLEPRNFAVFKKRLEDANMASQAHDFFEASGKWSAQLYRADMEMNLRTPHMAGFQLLDLQDYPGQGSAYVGILDAFMDSKGLITPEEWRKSCDKVVALAEFPTYTYTEGDTLRAKILVANYSGHNINNGTITAGLRHISPAQSKTIPSGQGLLDCGEAEFILPATGKAEKINLALEIPSLGISNSYPICVYPKNQAPAEVANVRSLDEAMKALDKGETVVFMPMKADVDSVSVGGLFQTDYWNWRMFKTISERNGKKVSPGTMGILVDPRHKAFAQFPTESHTSWQWYPIVKNSYPLVLDALNGSDYRPVVQVIDNIDRNHRLGLVSEFRVGKGKLLIVMADPEAMAAYPEGRQFIKAMSDYAASPEFNPAVELTPAQLRALFSTKAESLKIEKLDNISY